MTTGIYILTNLINNKRYVGQSWNIEKRLSEHCNTQNGSVISRAIKKYGWESFHIQQIPLLDNDIDQSSLDLLECQYIDSLNTSAKITKQISNALRGRVPWNKGIKMSTNGGRRINI